MTEAEIKDLYNQIEAILNELDILNRKLAEQERCMAPLRKINGEWTGNLAINDLKPSLSKNKSSDKP